MILHEYGTPVPSYPSYKGNAFQKRMDKMRHLINGIDECSLKQKDKIALRDQLIKMLNDFSPR